MQEAFQVLKLASQHDAFKRYSEASFLYLMAVDMLNSIKKDEENPDKVNIIENKIQQYKARAILISKLSTPDNKNQIETQNSSVNNSLQRSSDSISTENNTKTPKSKVKEALLLVKNAKELQKLGGNNLVKAYKLYDKSLKMLKDIMQSPSCSNSLKEDIKKRIVFIQNIFTHLKYHIQIIKLKLENTILQYYTKSHHLVEKAIELDEHQQYNEAIKVYNTCGVAFKKMVEANSDVNIKTIIANIIQLCQKRAEQLRLISKIELSSTGFRTLQGQEYKAEEPQQKGIFSSITDSISSVVSPQPNVGVVGVMLDEHPERNGEWLTNVTIDDTQTMQNPVDSSLNYTVYMMTITSKIMKDGMLIDTPSWPVIRRYHQFKVFHSKLKSLKIKDLPDFPPNKANPMSPQVIRERQIGFTKYFKELLSKPPNSQVNEICLRFLRNTFKREEAES